MNNLELIRQWKEGKGKPAAFEDEPPPTAAEPQLIQKEERSTHSFLDELDSAGSWQAWLERFCNRRY